MVLGCGVRRLWGYEWSIRGYSKVAMSWGEVGLESEVRAWYVALDEKSQARVGFHVDHLAHRVREDQLAPMR